MLPQNSKHLIQVTLILLIFYAGIGLSQTNLDSLWAVWKDTTQPDIIRLQALNDYAYKGYVHSQPDSAIYYARIVYEFAERKELKEQMSRALSTIGTSFYRKSDFILALQNTKLHLELQEEMGNKKGIASSLSRIGIIKRRQGDFKSAIDYYTRSLTLSEEIGDISSVATNLNNIGIIYYQEGQFARAIDCYTRSLTIREELGDKKGMAHSLNNIGILYRQQGEYSKAIEYYARSLAIKEELGDKFEIASSLHNIGNVYDEMGKYDKALEHHTRSLTIGEEIGDKRRIAFSLGSIGNIYANQGDYDIALNHFFRSLNIREEIGDKEGITGNLISISSVFRDSGNFNRAISYGDRALTLARERGAALETREASNTLYQAYKSTGQDSKALEMYKLYITMRDSILSEENQREVIRQEYKYNYEKQAIADSINYVEQQRIQEAEQERNLILSILGGIILVIIVATSIYLHMRKKAEEELRILSEVVKQSPMYIMISNPTGDLEYVNPAFTEITGYILQKVIGKNAGIIKSGETPKNVYKNLWDTILSGKTWSGEFKNKKKNGTFFWENAIISPIINTEGDITHFVAIKEDITMRKIAEQEIRKYQQQLRGLAFELSQSEERERREIAADVHDRIGHALAISKMKMAELEQILSSGEAEYHNILEETKEITDQLIQEIRTLTFEISPTILYELGLEAAIDWLAENFHKKHGLKIIVNDDGLAKLLDNEVRIILYKAVRELLFNIVKHAKVEQATVFIKNDNGFIKIVVEDKGTGFDVEQKKAQSPKSRSFGLFNIKERIDQLGGEFSIESQIGKGTKTTLTVPLKSN